MENIKFPPTLLSCTYCFEVMPDRKVLKACALGLIFIVRWRNCCTFHQFIQKFTWSSWAVQNLGVLATTYWDNCQSAGGTWTSGTMVVRDSRELWWLPWDLMISLQILKIYWVPILIFLRVLLYWLPRNSFSINFRYFLIPWVIISPVPHK